MFDYSPQHIITVNRGDSFELPLFINAGTIFEPIRYELKDGDKVLFAVKEPHQSFENAIVRKLFTNNDLNDEGDVIIKFGTSDTENLLPGIYYYAVKLQFADMNINTIITDKKFIII